MNRDTNLDKIKSFDSQWDIVIIGGGASGLGIAVDDSLHFLFRFSYIYDFSHDFHIYNFFFPISISTNL